MDCGCPESHPDGGRAQASTWQEDILLLSLSHEIKRAGNTLALPARAISTKNKHLLAIYSIPTRGFTADVSVFRGTPPPKPLECKFWLNTMDALFCDRWAYPSGGEPRLSRARFNFVSVDIIEVSPSFRSQIVHLSFLHWLMVIQGKQKPCLHLGKQGKQGLEKFYSSSFTCLPPGYPNSTLALYTTWIGQG